MDRHWLITWTCYGTWVAGDRRGFVANVRDETGKPVIHNVPGTPVDAEMPLLEAWMRDHMKDDAFTLTSTDAAAMIVQFQEVAWVRKWVLQAASVMYNHTHVVVGVPDDPSPDAILATLKSWASRKLKITRPLPANGTFWTANGSRRKLPDDEAIRAAIIYTIKKQPNPLAIWSAAEWQEMLEEYDRTRSE